MVTLVLGGMTIQMKHVVNNNGTPYYQRSVPKDLKQRIGKSLLKVKLEPAKGNIAVQAANLSREHDSLFKALRDDPSLTVSEQKVAAIALLAQFGLKQGDGNIKLQWPNIPANAPDDQPHLDPFLDAYAENRQDGIENPTEELARKILISPLPLLLSEALDIYFDNHKRGQDKEFQQTTKAHWDKLVNLTGDIALVSLDRDMARRYMISRLEKGLKTATVKREMNQLAAVTQKVIIEHRLAMRNPFERLAPQAMGLDAKKKIVFSSKQLQEILDACRLKDDDIRRIVILQIATGARIAEIVGLRTCDVSLSSIPSILIRPHFDSLGSRTLKTANSERTVPLLAFAAEAAKKQLVLVADSPYLFPRYNDGTVKSDAADAVVNKWLKKTTKLDATSHCFRHTIKTLLRDVTSKGINDQITGHSSGDIADEYGLGYSLNEQLKALKKAFKNIK